MNSGISYLQLQLFLPRDSFVCCYCHAEISGSNLVGSLKKETCVCVYECFALQAGHRPSPRTPIRSTFTTGRRTCRNGSGPRRELEQGDVLEPGNLHTSLMLSHEPCKGSQGGKFKVTTLNSRRCFSLVHHQLNFLRKVCRACRPLQDSLFDRSLTSNFWSSVSSHI